MIKHIYIYINKTIQNIKRVPVLIVLFLYIALYNVQCVKITFKREPVDIYHKYKLHVLSCAFDRFKLTKNAGIFYHKSISANHLPVWGHMFDRLHRNIKATFLMDFHFGNFCWTDIFVDQSSTKLIRNSQWPREFICVNYYFIILLFSFAVIQINSWKKN